MSCAACGICFWAAAVRSRYSGRFEACEFDVLGQADFAGGETCPVEPHLREHNLRKLLFTAFWKIVWAVSGAEGCGEPFPNIFPRTDFRFFRCTRPFRQDSNFRLTGDANSW